MTATEYRDLQPGDVVRMHMDDQANAEEVTVVGRDGDMPQVRFGDGKVGVLSDLYMPWCEVVSRGRML